MEDIENHFTSVTNDNTTRSCSLSDLAAPRDNSLAITDINNKTVTRCIAVDIGAKSGANCIAMIHAWRDKYATIGKCNTQHNIPKFYGMLVEYSSVACEDAVKLAYENHLLCIYVVSI